MKSKSLQECLNYIQVNLKAPKNMTNNFGNYKYRNLEGIFEGLKPLLEETGCIINITDSLELVGDRYYVKATATIIKGDESISCDGWARESEEKKGMDVAQITGSCSSYSRKYALSSLCCIDNSEMDIDSMDNTYTIKDGQKAQYQELLNSGAYPEKAKVNKWWKGFTTFEQAESGLEHMRNHVDNFKEKHNEKG